MYTSKYCYNEFAYCNPAYSKVSFILTMPPPNIILNLSNTCITIFKMNQNHLFLGFWYNLGFFLYTENIIMNESIQLLIFYFPFQSSDRQEWLSDSPTSCLAPNKAHQWRKPASLEISMAASEVLEVRREGRNRSLSTGEGCLKKETSETTWHVPWVSLTSILVNEWMGFHSDFGVSKVQG